MSDTIELTADEAACLIKIAHGIDVPTDRLERLDRIEVNTRGSLSLHDSMLWRWSKIAGGPRELTPRGRKLLEAYLAKHGEDA